MALQATIYLARATGPRPVSASRIARALDVSASYLAKVLHLLTRAGVLVSDRGRRGGYRLARPASEVSLCEVTAALGVPAGLHPCLLGRDDCPGAGCRVHGRWAEAIGPANRFLGHARLADLLRDAGPQAVEPGGGAVGCREGHWGGQFA